MLRVENLLHIDFACIFQVQILDLGTRHHQGGNGAVIQTENVFDHRVFLSIDHAGFTAFINHGVDFFFRDLLIVLFNTEDLKKHLCGEREQLHERHRQDRQPVNRFGNQAGDCICTHLTNTFRNQFTDDDGKIRDQDNHHSHRSSACCGSRNMKGVYEKVRKGIYQRRLTDNTGQNADGRNANLNRRKRSRRILRKRQRKFCAAGALIRQHLQFAAASGNNRDLAHGKKAVEENQQN